MAFEPTLEQDQFLDHSFLCNYSNDSTNVGALRDYPISEINGWDVDIDPQLDDVASVEGIIPTNDFSSPESINPFHAPPTTIHLHALINELQDFVGVDGPSVSPVHEYQHNQLIEMPMFEPTQQNDHLSLPNPEQFDLGEFLAEVPRPVVSVPQRKPRAAVKKIDKVAQKYIINSENNTEEQDIGQAQGNLLSIPDLPTLEADDIFGLLEQYEAVDLPGISTNSQTSMFEKESLSGNLILPEHIFDGLTVMKVEPIEETPIEPESQTINPDDYFAMEPSPPVAVKQETEWAPEQHTQQIPSLCYPVKIEPETLSINTTISRSLPILVEPEPVVPKIVKKPVIKSSQVPAPKVQPVPMIPGPSKPKREVPWKGKVGPQLKMPQEGAPSVQPPKPTIPTNKNKKELVLSKKRITAALKLSPPIASIEAGMGCSRTLPLLTQPFAQEQETVKPSLMSKPAVATEKIPNPTVAPQNKKAVGDPVLRTNNGKITHVTTAHNQPRKVLNELPYDLISRLKENRKRKVIPVIPAIPAKKCRGAPKPQPAIPQVVPNEPRVTVTMNNVFLDHNYCSKNIKQEQACTEPELPRVLMGNQPIVTNADGTLMVSLLKSNTVCTTDAIPKKKLDISEYKKRRGVIRPSSEGPNTSLDSNSSSSTCSSSFSTHEDEHVRIKNHQEKLMRMAKEVLQTKPKTEVKEEPIVVQVVPTQIKIPADMEKKTFVSFGVNTDFKIYKNLDPIVPVQQLEELRPLLQKECNKFNHNSLIHSVIDNLPRLITKTVVTEQITPIIDSEHGEDKTIVYTPKDRVPVPMADVAIQTDISLIRQTLDQRYRRRVQLSSGSSTSPPSYGECSNSSSSRSNNRHRKEFSNKNYQSPYSESSSGSYSGSPSGSTYEGTPKNGEVDERLVVYVGNFSDRTTKDDLRRRFSRFGPINHISLHFRKHGYLDNYGFVTYKNQKDAIRAIERGNTDPHLPKYEISFGGRREFCKTAYADLDNVRDDPTHHPMAPAQVSFDTLLRAAQEQAIRRKF